MMQFTTITYNYLKIMEAPSTKLQYIMVYYIFIISIYFFYRGHFRQLIYSLLLATNMDIDHCLNMFFLWRYSPNLGLGLPP
jgi:hypothetical protein